MGTANIAQPGTGFTTIKVPGAEKLEPFNIGFYQDQHFVSLAMVNDTSTEKLLTEEPYILESLEPDDETTRSGSTCADCGKHIEDKCLDKHMMSIHKKILKFSKTIRMAEGEMETESISEEWVEMEEDNFEDTPLPEVPYSNKRINNKANLEYVDFGEESEEEYIPSSPERDEDDDGVTITPPPPERPRRTNVYPNHCTICKKGFMSNIAWDVHKQMCIRRIEMTEDIDDYDILLTPPQSKQKHTEKRKDTCQIEEEVVNLAKKSKRACTECDKAFSSKSNLNRHMNKSH